MNYQLMTKTMKDKGKEIRSPPSKMKLFETVNSDYCMISIVIYINT